MHRYNLRSTRHHEQTADPAAALAIVAATIPLPTDTLKALRLTCQATRLSIDEGITALNLPSNAAQQLRVEGSTLVSGLASLIIEDHGPLDSTLWMTNACTMAKNNSESLEKLILFRWVACPGMPGAVENFLGLLKDHESWPKLRSLTLPSIPGMLDSFIKVEKMPELAELFLQGRMAPSDLAALLGISSFLSKVEVLDLGVCDSDANVQEFFELVGRLLRSAPRLRHFEMSAHRGRNLSFLNGAILPNLEDLEISPLPDDISLAPFASASMPRLQKLTLGSFAAAAAQVLPLMTAAESLPALEHLVFQSLRGRDYSFLREMQLTTLKTLKMHTRMTPAEVAHLGAALAQLPLLEELDISVNPYPQIFTPAPAMRSLLSGAAFPCLRRIKTSRWYEDDDSLRCLISSAHKLPKLEEIIFYCGQITPRGFYALAAAGRAGHFPLLKRFEICSICDDSGYSYDYFTIKKCIESLQKAWPGLAVVYEEDPYEQLQRLR